MFTEVSVAGEECSGHGQALPTGSGDSLHLCLSCREPPSTWSHPPRADEAGIEVQLSGPYKSQLWQATCASKLLWAACSLAGLLHLTSLSLVHPVASHFFLGVLNPNKYPAPPSLSPASASRKHSLPQTLSQGEGNWR